MAKIDINSTGLVQRAGNNLVDLSRGRIHRRLRFLRDKMPKGVCLACVERYYFLELHPCYYHAVALVAYCYA